MAPAQNRSDALESGRAWVDHSDRVLSVEVAGADARAWLGDLVTGPIVPLVAGAATRSLLLTPTGRIRADLWIKDASTTSDITCIQRRDQPKPIDALLAPYVLSSSISITPQRLHVVSEPWSGLHPRRGRRLVDRAIAGSARAIA